MIALVFEVYGAVCFFSLLAFLVLASVAKLRPDLDEEWFDIPVEVPTFQILTPSAPPHAVERGKRPIQKRPRLIHRRKPRAI